MQTGENYCKIPLRVFLLFFTMVLKALIRHPRSEMMFSFCLIRSILFFFKDCHILSQCPPRFLAGRDSRQISTGFKKKIANSYSKYQTPSPWLTKSYRITLLHIPLLPPCSLGTLPAPRVTAPQFVAKGYMYLSSVTSARKVPTPNSVKTIQLICLIWLLEIYSCT